MAHLSKITIAILLALLVALAFTIDSKAAHRHHRPRAARILERGAGATSWICPDSAVPPHDPIVGRDICFLLGWPEPTL